MRGERASIEEEAVNPRLGFYYYFRKSRQRRNPLREWANRRSKRSEPLSRTDRLIESVTAALDRQRASIDAMDGMQKVVVTLKVNEAGYARASWVAWESHWEMGGLTRQRVAT